MKTVIIRSHSGHILDMHESNDISSWLLDGMVSNKWGASGEFVIDIKDKEKLENKSSINKEKRLGLARDFEALMSNRSEKLKIRIYKWILENVDINVEDI